MLQTMFRVFSLVRFLKIVHSRVALPCNIVIFMLHLWIFSLCGGISVYYTVYNLPVRLTTARVRDRIFLWSFVGLGTDRLM